MTAFFTLTVLFIFPLLYYSFVNTLPFACVLNFVTVLCFLGIHAVARELEEPFKNVPNGMNLTQRVRSCQRYTFPCNSFHPIFLLSLNLQIHYNRFTADYLPSSI